MEEKLCISVPEAAALLGVGKTTMYEWARIDGFPCIKVGNRYLISVSGLKAWVRKMSGEEALSQ